MRIGGIMDKEHIKEFGYELGADAVGIAAIEDYKSPQSPDPRTLLHGVKSIIVMGYRENYGAVESENARISMASRMGGMELSLKNNYLMARYVENQFGSKAAPVPFSYPLDMGPEVMGLVGDLSMRHAAVAAGLGVFGRHNLVIHPRFGTRIIFTAILTELALSSDPPVQEDLCTECGLCVESCPGQALDVEGRTDQIKCLKASQPYSIGGVIRYFRKFIGASPEEQKALFKDPILLSLYQAQFIGFQYTCWKCMAVCPACMES
jgi:epoxyqueuosine reductase